MDNLAVKETSTPARTRTTRLTVIVHAATYPNLDPVPDDVLEEVRWRAGDDAVCALWFGRCRVHGEVWYRSGKCGQGF
jgi:hypothetical protein